MKLKSIFILAMLGIFYAAQAQDSGRVFSLEEAVQYAMENNKTLQNAREDVRLAHAQYREAAGAGLPQVEAGMDYMTYFNYELSFLSGSGGGPSVVDGLPTTTSPSVQDMYLANVFDGFLSGFSSPTVMGDQITADVQVTQLIFSGQFWVGLQLAKLGKSIYETNLVKSEQDTREQVISAYYTILATEKLQEIIEKNIADLNEIYMHTQNMYTVGVSEQTDVDQIGINVTQLKNAKSQMERNIQLSYNMFRMVLGVETGADVKLSDDLFQLTKEVEQSALLAQNFDLNDNVNYQLLAQQEIAGEKQVNMQRSAYLPTVAAFYNYTEKIKTSGFDLTPASTAGVTLSVPIFAGGTKQAQLSQKKIELDKIQRNKSLLQDQLNMQHRQLVFEFSNALENYNLQKENKDVAMRMFTNINNKYKQGLVSSLELTQANTNYLQAESNYISSILTLLQSKLSLEKLYNNI